MVQQGPRTLRNIIGAALKRLAKRIDPTPSPEVEERDFLDEAPLSKEASSATRARIADSSNFRRSLGEVSGAGALKRQELRPPEKTLDVNVELKKPAISPQETPEPDVRTSNSPFKHITEIHHLEKEANNEGWFSSPNTHNARNLYRELPKLRSLLKSTDDLSEVLSIGNRYDVFKAKDGALIKAIVENELNSDRGRLHVLPHAVLAGLKVGAFTRDDAAYLEKIVNHLYQANEIGHASSVLMHGVNHDVLDVDRVRPAFEHLLKMAPKLGYSVAHHIASNGVNCGALDGRHENVLYELAKSAVTDNKTGPWPYRAAELLRLSHYIGTRNEKTIPLYLTAARIALEHNMPRELDLISEVIKTTGVNVTRVPKVVKSFNRVLDSVAQTKPDRTYVAGLRFAARHKLLPLPAIKVKLLNLIDGIQQDADNKKRSTHLAAATSALHEFGFINEDEYRKRMRKISDLNENPEVRKEFYEPSAERPVPKVVVRRRKNRVLK